MTFRTPGSLFYLKKNPHEWILIRLKKDTFDKAMPFAKSRELIRTKAKFIIVRCQLVV